MEKVACLLLALLSVVSATWIFPDRQRPSRTIAHKGFNQALRKTDGAQLGVLQDRLSSAHHLSLTGRFGVKVPRSIDIHPYGGRFPSLLTSNTATISSYKDSNCCASAFSPSLQHLPDGNTFKPSAYYYIPPSQSSRDTTIPTYIYTQTTTTHKPIQTYNSTPAYKPNSINKYTATTHRPAVRSDSVYQHTPSYESFPAYKSTSGYESVPTYAPITTYKPIYYKYTSPPPTYESTYYGQKATAVPAYRQRKGKSYHYGYDVSSHYHGAAFQHQEQSDGDTVHGEYRVRLPDGRLQIVTYTADHERGFVPVVRYEGPQTLTAANTHFQPPT